VGPIVTIIGEFEGPQSSVIKINLHGVTPVIRHTHTKQLTESKLKKAAAHHESAWDRSMFKSTFAFLILWKYTGSE
jgi:hypothetical protein